ncbi:hypothetical protein [Mucilaginibacter sp.]
MPERVRCGAAVPISRDAVGCVVGFFRLLCTWCYFLLSVSQSAGASSGFLLTTAPEPPG